MAQIKGRAARLHVLHDNLLALATARVEDVLPLIEGDCAPSLVIIDSVQTLSSDNAEGLPGNVSQVRAVATELVECAKRSQSTLVLVGHVTKDGALAGPRLLEHLVDVVISLEGERRQMFRLLRVLKNRFGPNEELLVFEWLRMGLKWWKTLPPFFWARATLRFPGQPWLWRLTDSAPLAVEVQALVTHSYLSIARRSGLGFDVNRLHVLLAVFGKTS